jgi:RNA polymerase sigma-70 factor (ECF subfamily)
MTNQKIQTLRCAAATPGIVPPGPEDLADWMRETYPELRRIAAHYFHRESPNQTLQRTALVHETFIRLTGHGPKKYVNRAHFFAVVARSMQQILVEHARRRLAQKRGGVWQRIPFDEIDIAGPEDLDGLALDGALKRLNALDPKLCRIVELRLLVGLSTGETAVVLRRGQSTIRRDWAIAKAWLRRELERSLGDSQDSVRP